MVPLQKAVFKMIIQKVISAIILREGTRALPYAFI
jgi:hypothetical protein